MAVRPFIGSGTGVGGIGTPPYDTRGTDSLPAIFTSLALRDTYYTTNASEIGPGSLLAQQRRSVGIGPTDGSAVGVTSAFIRNDDNTGWIPIPAFQGPQGIQGPAGTSIRRMFESISVRDTFYNDSQANRDTLSTGSIIEVRVEQGVVELQEWLGSPQPTAYGINGPNNWETVSIRTDQASIEFARNLRIFDYGQIPAFQDMVNNILALAIGQRYTESGGSQNARQLKFPAASQILNVTGSTNSVTQAVHTYSIDTTGLINDPAIITEGTINFVVAPNFYVVEIFQGTDDTGPLTFKYRFEPGGTVGVFTARPDAPQRFVPNTNYFVRLTGDIPFQYVMVDTPGQTNPVGSSQGFEITFEDLATQNFVTESLGGLGEPVALTSNITISLADVPTYERKFIYTPASVTSPVSITIAEDIDFEGFTVFAFGSGNITINASGTNTIEGQSSFGLSQYEGARVVQVPNNNSHYGLIYSNKIVSDENIQDVVGQMVTGNVENNISVTYDDINGKLNFSVTGIASSVPSLHNFSIDIPSRVDLNTDLNVAKTISFDVSNHSSITALSLVITVGTDQTLTLPIRDGIQSQSVTLAGIDTSSAGTVTFQLSGTYSGGTITSNLVTVNIANLQSGEQAYYAVLADEASFSTANVNDQNVFTSVDVTNSGTVYDINISIPNGRVLGILSPDNRDPVSIQNTVSNRPALDTFNLTNNVRTIGSLQYNLRAAANNSGFEGTGNYRVTTE